mmetsp:Transcript_31636/g.99224  ORF Transcript_31636/g.99224 Transcript_31636/m.99224 type:complete len:381 (-) Transcript_31636:2-1144(-)
MLRVQTEDLAPAGRLGRSKMDAHVEAREEGRVEVRASVRRGDQRRVRLRVHPIKPPQQHGEHAARRLVDLARSRAGERVQLVEEEDAPAEPSALVEEGSELLLRLAVPLAHQRLERCVYERKPRLCRRDFRRRRLTGARRAVKEQCSGAVRAERARALAYRREGLWVLEGQQQRFLHLHTRLLCARQRLPRRVSAPRRAARRRHHHAGAHCAQALPGLLGRARLGRGCVLDRRAVRRRGRTALSLAGRPHWTAKAWSARNGSLAGGPHRTAEAWCAGWWKRDRRPATKLRGPLRTGSGSGSGGELCVLGARHVRAAAWGHVRLELYRQRGRNQREEADHTPARHKPCPPAVGSASSLGRHARRSGERGELHRWKLLGSDA